jgi:hypothetical protein
VMVELRVCWAEVWSKLNGRHFVLYAKTDHTKLSNKLKLLICCSNYFYDQTTSCRKAKCSKLSENEAKLSPNIEIKIDHMKISNKFELR